MCKSLIDQYFSTNFTTGAIGSTTATIGSTNGTISATGCWNFQGSLVANGTNGNQWHQWKNHLWYHWQNPERSLC